MPDSITPFSQWVSTQPQDQDRLDLMRKYSRETKINLLRSGQYDPETAGYIDEALMTKAAEEGIDLGEDPAATFYSKAEDDDSDLLYRYATEAGDAPLADAARTYSALRSDRVKSSFPDQESYLGKLEEAKANLDGVISSRPVKTTYDDPRNAARKAAVDRGDKAFAFLTESDGSQRLYASPRIEELANDDEAMARYLESDPSISPDVVPFLKQKAQVLPGYSVPEYKRERQQEFTAAAANAMMQDPASSAKMKQVIDAASAGGENLTPQLEQLDTYLANAGLHAEFTDAEERMNFLSDMVKLQVAPKVDTENVDNNVIALSTGEVRLPDAVLFNKELFNKTLSQSTQIPAEQKDRILAQRDSHLETVAPSAFATIASRKGSEFIKFRDEQKAAGKTDGQILESWMNDKENDPNAWDRYVGGAAMSVADAAGTLFLGPLALMGNTSATDTLQRLQKDQASRKAYSQLYGQNLGWQFDLQNTLAPVAADLATSFGIGAAVRATAGAAVKTSLKAGLRATLRTALTEEANSMVTRFLSRSAAREGTATTADEVITLAGRDMVKNLTSVGSNVGMNAVWFNRSASSTYVGLTSALEAQGKTPEQAREIALPHAMVAGAITLGVTNAFQMLGAKGLERVLTGDLTRGQVSGIYAKLRNEWASLPASFKEGIDMASADTFLRSTIRKGIQSSVLRGVPADAAAEALEEATDSALNAVNEQIGRGEKINVDAAIKEGVYAGMIGGALGGGVAAIRSGVIGNETPEAEAARVRRETLLSVATKLDKANAPETARALRRLAAGPVAPAEEVPVETPAEPAPVEPTQAITPVEGETPEQTPLFDPELLKQYKVERNNIAAQIDDLQAEKGGSVGQAERRRRTVARLRERAKMLDGIIADAEAGRTIQGGTTASEFETPGQKGERPYTSAAQPADFAVIPRARGIAGQLDALMPPAIEVEAVEIPRGRLTNTAPPDAPVEERIQEAPQEDLPQAEAEGGVEQAPSDAGVAGVEVTTLGNEPITRNPAKVSQMTPAEYVAWSRENGREKEKGKQLAKLHKADIEDLIREELDTTRANAEADLGFLGPQYPLSAEAVETYKIKLPEGYVREGDLFVYRPTEVPLPDENQIQQASPLPAEQGQPVEGSPEGEAPQGAALGQGQGAAPSALKLSEGETPEQLYASIRANKVAQLKNELNEIAKGKNNPKSKWYGAAKSETTSRQTEINALESPNPTGWGDTIAALDALLESKADVPPVWGELLVKLRLSPNELDARATAAGYVKQGDTYVYGGGAAPSALKLSEGATQTLIQTKHIGNFSGPSNADIRAAIMSEIAGKKVPKSKAGYNVFVDAVATHYGVTKEDKTIAAYETAIMDAVKATTQAAPAQAAQVSTELTEEDRAYFQNQVDSMNEFLKTATDPDQIRAAKDIIASAEFMLKDTPTAPNFDDVFDTPSEVAVKETAANGPAYVIDHPQSIDMIAAEAGVSPDGMDAVEAAQVATVAAAPQTTAEPDAVEQRDAVEQQGQPTERTTVVAELEQYGFNPNNVTGFLQSVASKSKKPHERQIASLLVKHFGDMLARIPVTLSNLPDENFAGMYLPKSGQIVINSRRVGPRGAVDTVLHELLHAATVESIKNPTAAQQKILNRLDRVRQSVQRRALKDDKLANLRYGTSSIDEFVTHFWTDPDFRKAVGELTPKGEKNWLRVIMDTIRDLLNGRVRTESERISAEVMADMTSLLETAAARPWGPSKSDVYLAMPGQATDTARFIELTEDLYRDSDEATAEQIAAWREANPGKWEELSVMREKALREMGYDIGPVFHGTEDPSFNVFDGDVIHFGTLQAAREIMDKKGGMEIEYSIDDPDSDGEVWAWSNHSSDGIGPFKSKKEAAAAIAKLPTEIRPYRVFLKIENPAYDVDAGGTGAWRKAKGRLIAAKGHDGISYTNEVEDAGSTSYAVFDPSQIKSADPISPGPRILPDEWADTESPDIRYQPSETQPMDEVQSDPIQSIRNTLTGFLPDGMTPDEFDIDLISQQVDDIDPVNAEAVIRAHVNHAVAVKAAEDALGDTVDVDEKARLKDLFTRITTGNTTDADIVFHRSNPDALQRLMRYLAAAFKSLVERVKLGMGDKRTAVMIDRIGREYHRAKTGWQSEPTTRVFDEDEPKMLYAGENAQYPQFMRDSLETAKAMAAAGKSSEQIRSVTGWFPGPYDGKMRWEIPDEGVTSRRDELLASLDGDSSRWVVGKKLNEIQEAEMGAAIERVQGAPKDQLIAESRRITKKHNAEKEAFRDFYAGEDNPNRKNDRVPLWYLLDHPALFEAYPEIRNLPVSFTLSDIGDAGSLGAYNKSTNIIALNPLILDSDQEVANTLLHEIQHWIQKKEGTPRGGNESVAANTIIRQQRQAEIDRMQSTIDTWRSRAEQLRGVDTQEARDEQNALLLSAMDLEQRKNRATDNLNAPLDMAERQQFSGQRGFEAYQRIAGEIEARDVQARANFTPEQRAAIAPYSSENIATEDAIVLYQPSTTVAENVEEYSPQNWINAQEGNIAHRANQGGDLKGVSGFLKRMFIRQTDMSLAAENTRRSFKYLENARNELVRLVAVEYDKAIKGTVVTDEVRDNLNRAIGTTEPQLTRSDTQRINEEVKRRQAVLAETEDAERKEAQRVARNAIAAAKRQVQSDLRLAEEIEEEGRLKTQARKAAISDYEKAYKRIRETRQKAYDQAKEKRASGENTVMDFQRDMENRAMEANMREFARQRDLSQQWLDTNAPKVGTWVRRFRSQRLALQKEFIKLYPASEAPDFHAKLTRSEDLYLVRSYAIHHNPALAQQMLNDPKFEQIRQSAIETFRKSFAEQEIELMRNLNKYQGLTDEQLAAAQEQFSIGREVARLQRKAGPEADPEELMSIAKVNVAERARLAFEDFIMGHDIQDTVESATHGLRLPIDRLRQKKDIDPAIREALQEVTDPLFNSLRTLEALSKLITSNRQTAELAAIGTAEGWLITKAQKDANRNLYDKWVPIVSANPEHRSYPHLAGLYTSPEGKKAFDSAYGTGGRSSTNTSQAVLTGLNNRLRNLAGVSMGVVTLGNLAYFTRGFAASHITAIAVGAIPFASGGAYKKGYRMSLFSSVLGEGTRWFDTFVKDPETFRNQMLELVSSGVLKDANQVSYLNELIEAGAKTPSQAVELAEKYVNKASIDALGTIKGKASKALEFLTKMADFTEGVVSPIVYYYWKDLLTKAKFGTEKEIMQEAARRTKRVTPTHSMRSQAVETFSQNGISALMAPFIGFKSEMIRSTVEIYRLIQEDYNSGNDVLRRSAHQRAAIAATVHGGLTMIAPLALAASAGIGDDEDEAIRAALPSYSQNSSFIPLINKDDKTITLVDLTFANPYSFPIDPFTSTMRNLLNGKPEDIPNTWYRFLADGMFGEQVAISKLIDVKRNINETTGLPIYLESDTDAEKLRKSLMHVVGGAYTPATIKKLADLKDSLNDGDTGRDNWWYSPAGITFSMVAIFRPRNYRIEDMRFRAFNNQRKANSELWQITSSLKSPAPLDASVEDIYADRVDATRRVWQKIDRLASGFEGLGSDKNEIARSMLRTGLSRRRTTLLLNGNVTDLPVMGNEERQDIYRISPERLRQLDAAYRMHPRYLQLRD